MLSKTEYIKIVNEMTIPSLEYQGAHILASHYNISDEKLKRRLTSKREEIVAATVFDVTQDELLQCIKDAFLDEEFQTPESVIEWLEDTSDSELFIVVKKFDRPIGHGYYKYKWHDWSQGAISCDEITIALKKVERRYDTTFRVITAYPSSSLEK